MDELALAKMMFWEWCLALCNDSTFNSSKNNATTKLQWLS